MKMSLIAAVLILFLFGCNNLAGPDLTGTDDDTSEASDTTDTVTPDHEEDTDIEWDESEEILITLSDSDIASESEEGVTISETTITITSAGTYRITGTLSDGRIIVDTEDSEVVQLILEDANITCTTNAPIDIESAEKTVIIIEGTNIVTDGSEYILPDGDDEPNAALYSRDDLTIYGSDGGTLTVTGNYNDAIGCKDGLVLHDADITVNSVDDGIRGKDYLVVRGGTITVNSTGDGLKSDYEGDSELGYISIESGTLNITTGQDGDAIQAESKVLISGGTFIISTGGTASSLGDDDSAKGIKAELLVDIDAGDFTLDTLDDAIHSNDTIVIDGGTFTIASGDDGIHSDTALTINGGTFDITESYEGIESAVIEINDGTFRIVSSDDGVNVAGGNDTTSPDFFTPPSGDASDQFLYINGGYLSVNASGDGLDANGSIEMTGGTVLVHGPTDSNNGALDYDGSFAMDSGLLVAAGSSGMAEAPSSDSQQYSVKITYSSTKSAGTLVHIEDGDGNYLLTFAPEKAYQSVVFSSPDLEYGKRYYIYSGGSCDGKEEDGLYSDGDYSGSTSEKSFTVISRITSVQF